MIIDPNVRTQGINSISIDGFSDFFGQIGQTIGGGVVEATGLYVDNWVGSQFPERVPPQDFSNGSTGSPRDNAINEIKDTTEAQEVKSKNMLILAGLATVALLATVTIITRR